MRDFCHHLSVFLVENDDCLFCITVVAARGRLSIHLYGGMMQDHGKQACLVMSAVAVSGLAPFK